VLGNSKLSFNSMGINSVSSNQAPDSLQFLAILGSLLPTNGKSHPTHLSISGPARVNFAMMFRKADCPAAFLAGIIRNAHECSDRPG